jgi:hypothetical protein
MFLEKRDEERRDFQRINMSEGMNLFFDRQVRYA